MLDELSQQYTPEIWPVEKDVIYAASKAVSDGLYYAKEALLLHDASLGRTTRKNKAWAETMEAEIRHMQRTHQTLLACGQEWRKGESKPEFPY